MASGDDNRLSRFVTNLYRGALQRDPNSTELQNGISSLGSAGANGGYSSLLNVASSLALMVRLFEQAIRPPSVATGGTSLSHELGHSSMGSSGQGPSRLHRPSRRRLQLQNHNDD